MKNLRKPSLTSASAPFGKALLSNGMTLVAETHPHVHSACLGVWVRVGSGHEPSAISGVSHFIEHMVFKGTSTRTPLQIATVLEGVGGDLNAFTDREVTCYHATTLSEHLDLSLDVLSDLVIRPTFPKVEMERERKVLLQELSMIEEAPDDLIQDVFLSSVWKKQSLGRPIIGSRQTIQKISRPSLTNFFKKNYFAENMVISASGNFEFEWLRDRCEAFFRDMPRGVKAPEKTAVLGKYKAVKLSEKADTEQVHLMLGFEGLGYRHRERFDLLLLTFILGGGMSSRLFQEIREKAGLAYTVDCDCVPFLESGVVTIYVAMAPKSLNQCLRILGQQLQKLKDMPVTLQELEQVKGQIKGSILLSNDQMETRSEALARNEFVFGRYIAVEEILKELNAVTPEKIQAMAQRVFVPERESLVVLARKPPKAKSLSVFGD